MKNVYCVVVSSASMGGINWFYEAAGADRHYHKLLSDPYYDECDIFLVTRQVSEGFSIDHLTVVEDEDKEAISAESALKFRPRSTEGSAR